MITIRFYNKQTRAMSTTRVDRSILIRISDFFQNLVEKPKEGGSKICLEEEHAYEAGELLINIVNFYRKKDEGGETAPPVQVFWDRSKAIMSTKWRVQQYVDAYGALIKKHIEDVC